MQIGALGDIHGAFETVHTIMARHSDVPLWVCVGDVATNDGEYFAPAAPLYFIKGNNEDFDVLAEAAAGRPPAPHLHYLPNGGPYTVGSWRVAALGGTFAPSCLSRGMGACMTSSSVSTASSPRKSRRPARHSHITMPSEKRSLCCVHIRRLSTRSGARYASLPFTSCVRVTWSRYDPNGRFRKE